MVERLRSIARRTHWSLLLKAFLFVLGWLLFPLWGFVFLAFVLYLFPRFQSGKFAVPALLTLGAALLVPTHLTGQEVTLDIRLPLALILGTTLYLLLGIKELVFVRRAAAYELASLLTIFLYIVWFFDATQSALTLSVLGASVVLVGAIGLLFGFHGRIEPIAHTRRERVVVIGVASLIIFELSLLLVVLPFAHLAQTAFLFLGVVMTQEFLLDRARGMLSRERMIRHLVVSLGIGSAILLSIMLSVGS